MTDSEFARTVLIEGAVLALVFVVIIAFLLSRFVGDVFGRAHLIIFLFAAAGAYFGFAILGRETRGTEAVWTLIELLQVFFFGILGLLGLRGSALWIALGWALHPVWDFVLHYLGPGSAFAPKPYVIACISFDLLVAAYIVTAYKLIGSGRLGFKGLNA